MKERYISIQTCNQNCVFKIQYHNYVLCNCLTFLKQTCIDVCILHIYIYIHRHLSIYSSIYPSIYLSINRIYLWITTMTISNVTLYAIPLIYPHCNVATPTTFGHQPRDFTAFFGFWEATCGRTLFLQRCCLSKVTTSERGKVDMLHIHIWCFIAFWNIYHKYGCFQE